MERERERLLAEREDAHLSALRELKKKSEDALREQVGALCVSIRLAQRTKGHPAPRRPETGAGRGRQGGGAREEAAPGAGPHRRDAPQEGRRRTVTRRRERELQELQELREQADLREYGRREIAELREESKRELAELRDEKDGEAEREMAELREDAERELEVARLSSELDRLRLELDCLRLEQEEHEEGRMPDAGARD